MSGAPDRVSVVVPVHDGRRYLAEALRSVLGEGRAVAEVVVVDDGSSDDSAAVAAAFGPPVRVVRQPRAGPAAARNRGIEEASGTVLAFLDADDLWPAGRLGWMTAALGDAGMVSGAVEAFVSPELGDGEGARLHCPGGTMPGGGMAGAMVVPSSTFARQGLFDVSLRSGEVMDWYLRAVDAGVGEVRLPEVVLRRRLHLTNHGRTQPAARSDYLRVVRALLERRRRNGGADG